MPKLRMFTFYFATETFIDDPSFRLSISDMKQTFTCLENRQVTCAIDFDFDDRLFRRVFTLSFKFDRLEKIRNNIPNMIFNYVSHVKLDDAKLFKHEFFIRLAQVFPFLKKLSICNAEYPAFFFIRLPGGRSHIGRKGQWDSIIEFPHLISLEFGSFIHSYYIEHLLNHRKTRLPCLMELKIKYEDLKSVTNNFTRNDIRRNCKNVKRLILEQSIVHSKDVYDYFRSL